MYKRYQHIHFVGIGGIGMSGIAELLLNLGYRISGSDVRASDITRRLESLGARIFIGHDPTHVGGADVVVLSSAIREDNPEVVAARKRGNVPVIRRAEMLAELMRLKYSVLVAGAHGKTTTTSMVATVLARGGLDPTVIIGGKLNAWGTNAKLGSGDFVVAEADESDGTFLLLSPTIAVVTNIDLEHVDFYRDLDHIRETFLEFVNKVPFYGQAILCLEDENIQHLLPRVEKRFVTYGFSSQADFQARDVRVDGPRTLYRAFHRDRELGQVVLPIPGRHNVLNSLAAVAAGVELDLGWEDIQRGLEDMTGVQRRFHVKGEAAGVLVLDDYGHHPTEIRAVLSALSESYPDRRKVVAFQPHRYSRTRGLMDQFAKCFYQSDVLLVTEIYAAGEAPMEGVTGKRLAEEVARYGHHDITYCETLDGMTEALLQRVQPGDVVVTLGAGNIWQVGDNLLERLGARAL
ncbi:UDP-N-acetylmuramate--L-alanine ligase [Desulfacinum infernum DSM 9756]|uniref:UDP-N-acetylmuramate--L-alanine ligase n=1 Tax=Desulfacinum infernum DSM 9756 TaxID=1121391 RepID=A0A1M5H540_9BACT|nr:UDP-N-acetylmuramate--L-alanine ligase [Desulfacinum infernum]SHG11129.1 UDP-N-acetylmuramate--L-alanine ligase [Desulfacinum infernum DSM 9756]